MAQIIINIPDATYDFCNKYGYDNNIISQAVKYGILLPKGHGRVIDADALQRTYCEDNCGARKCTDAMDRCVFIGAVLEAPTIIEADKENTNESLHD